VLQSIEATSEYQKRCYDSITPIVEENEHLKKEVAYLHWKLKEA
jgi:hypothetical protein